MDFPLTMLTVGWKIWELFFCNLTILISLKISMGGNFEPSAHTDTARVALFVSFIEEKMLSYFIPFYSRTFFESQVKNIEV